MHEANSNKLHVQLLGEFKVTFGNKIVVDKKTRNSKSIELFKYFLCNKNTMISQEQLISELLPNDEATNQLNILKNIVYRLRKLFIQVGMDKNSIRYEKSSYGFFCDDDSYFDSDEFIDLLTEIRANHGEDESLLLDRCYKALNLYKNGFLPSVSSQTWVLKHASIYQTKYIECLYITFELSKYLDKYSKVFEYLSHAIKIYPYEEDLWIMYLTTLSELKKPKEALKEYDRVAAMLYNDLGIGPSPELEDLRDRIASYTTNSAGNLVDVRKNISEDAYSDGAYFCNLGVFSNIYQFTIRHMERSGKSVFLMLCTISEIDGTLPESGERFNLITSNFYTTIMNTCRRADVYTRYSATQFLIMFIDTTKETCDLISKRIQDNFKKKSKMFSVKLDFKSISAVDLEHILKNYEGNF